MRIAVLWIAVAGCAPRSELLVVLSSDLDLPSQANALEISVTYPDRMGQLAFDHLYKVPADATLPASIDLVSSADPPPTVEILAQLFLDGKHVVDRRAIVALVRGQSRLLRLPLDRSCVGVMKCVPEVESCFNGGCVPVVVPPEQLGQIPPDPLKVDAGAPPDLKSAQCPLPSLPPQSDGGCTLYAFNRATPNGLSSNEVASGAALTFECAGMAHIVVPANTPHRFDSSNPRSAFLFQEQAMLQGDSRVTAVFHSKLAGLAGLDNVGIELDDGINFIAISLGQDANYSLDAWSSPNTENQEKFPPELSVFDHTLSVASVTLGMGRARVDLVGEMIASMSLPQSLNYPYRRGFFVANGQHGDPAIPAVDVFLEYLVACP